MLVVCQFHKTLHNLFVSLNIAAYSYSMYLRVFYFPNCVSGSENEWRELHGGVVVSQLQNLKSFWLVMYLQ